LAEGGDEVPLEPSPYIKKAMEALGCANSVPVEEAQKVLQGFLGEGERVVRAKIEGSNMTPLGILMAAVNQMPAILAVTQISAMTKIASKDAATGVDSSPLGKMLAVIATAATFMLKDMSFIGGDGGIDGDCTKCTYKDKCPTGIERNKNG